MPKCTICHHPQRHDIDQALLAENAAFADLSRKYGLSLSALWRHKKHLQEKMRRAAERLQHRLRQDCLFQFNEFLETARHLNRTALADGDARRALQAIREGTRILNFITKLDVRLDADTVYRLLASPQWVSQDSLLPTDPQFKADGHQSLACNFFSPCPEIPPDPQGDTWDEEDAADLAQTSFLETSNSELAVAAPAPDLPGAGSPDISSLFPLPFSPGSAPPPGIEICSFPLEINPPNQREISAKLPKKTKYSEVISEQYQSNMSCEKNGAKNPHVRRESDSASAPPAVRPSSSLPGESHPPATKTKKQKPTTRNPKLLFLPVLPRNCSSKSSADWTNRSPNPKPKTKNWQPKTVHQTSAKLARKLPKNQPLSELYTKQYQFIIQCEKYAAENSCRGRESTAPPAFNCPPPLELSAPLPKTGNHQLGTRNSSSPAPETGTGNPDISSIFPDVSPERGKMAQTLQGFGDARYQAV